MQSGNYEFMLNLRVGVSLVSVKLLVFYLFEVLLSPAQSFPVLISPVQSCLVQLSLFTTVYLVLF